MKKFFIAINLIILILIIVLINGAITNNTHKGEGWLGGGGVSQTGGESIGNTDETLIAVPRGRR